MIKEPGHLIPQHLAEPTPHHQEKLSKIDQMMSQWKNILHDDSITFSSTEQSNEYSAAPSQERRHTIEYYTLSSGSLITGEFLPYNNNSSTSIGSIECQAITLDTDFHSGPKRDLNSNQKKKKTSSPLAKAERKLVKFTKNVTKYYDNLWKQFEEVESILRLPNVSLQQQGNINSISAQLWFATYLQAREFNSNYDLANDPYQIRFLCLHFCTISKWAKTLVTMHSLLRECMQSFDTIGRKHIREMKILLTGNSATDLMRINELTPYDDLLQTPDLWIMNNYKQIQNDALLKASANNKGQKPINLGRMLTEHRQFIKSEHQNHPKILQHDVPILRKSLSSVQIKTSRINKRRRNSDLYSLNPFNQIVHDFRDSLEERRNMDIFMKNITKCGWMDYDKTFPNKQKIPLIRELINHTILGFQKLIKRIPKLMKQLKHGNNPIGCCTFLEPNTFLPWIEQSTKVIHYCGQHKNWMKAGDFERLRFNVLANEVQLTTLIAKGKQIETHIYNIIKIINVSTNLLYHQHNIQIPNYAHNHKLMTSELQTSDTYHGFISAEDGCDYDDEEFYLCEYSQILKHIPLYFHITEFILSKRLPIEETKVFGTHSDIKFF